MSAIEQIQQAVYEHHFDEWPTQVCVPRAMYHQALEEAKPYMMFPNIGAFATPGFRLMGVLVVPHDTDTITTSH